MRDFEDIRRDKLQSFIRKVDYTVSCKPWWKRIIAKLRDYLTEWLEEQEKKS